MIKKKLRKSEKCLNCHEIINDANYCPHCGQLNTHKNLKTREFLSDFFDEFLTFDSKFFKSFFPLIFKPGHLTNQYTSGKRVNYVRPLRMYIFISILFFLLLSVNVKWDQAINLDENEKTQQHMVDDVLKNYSTDIPIETRVKLGRELTEKLEIREKVDVTFLDPVAEQEGFKNSFLFKYFKEKVETLSKQGKDGAISFLKEMVNQSPQMLFILLPLIALFLKLLYIRRKTFYIKHLIFTVHIHTVFFIFFLLFMLFPKWWVSLICVAIMWLYLYISMLKVYKQGWFKTLVKQTIFIFSYLIFFIPVGITILVIISFIMV